MTRLKLLCLLLACAFAACRSGGELTAIEPASVPTFQCQPKDEGRLVSGSSGVVMGVPLRGEIIKRLPDGRNVTARRAELVFNPQHESMRETERIRLDRRGHFERTVNLDFDTTEGCAEGALTTHRVVEEIDVLVRVPGCADRSIHVTERGISGPVVLDCTG